MKRIITESCRHFERIADDVKGKDVVVEVRKVEDGEALYRATCKLFGITPRERSKEEKKRKEIYWGLVEAMLKRHGLSLKDVSLVILKDGLKKVVLGEDVIDVVRDIERIVTG